jgi:hypothetical protein
VFVDTAQGTDVAHPVLLEVTAASATSHQIAVLLRNASGWYKSRTGQGDWSIDVDDESCNAKIWFSSNQRIPGAGAPLDDTGSWYLTLHVRTDGSVVAEPRGWELQRVADADVAAAKAEFGYAAAAGRGDQRPGTKDEGPGGAGAPSFETVGAGLSRDSSASDQRPLRTSVPPSVGSASVTPIDRSTVTPPCDQPLDRSTVQPNPSTDAGLASALHDLSLIAGTRTGAYALVSGSWVRLPTNGAKAVQSAPQKLTGLLQNLGSLEDRMAGKSSEPASTEIAEIRFDGIEPVPAVPARDVVIVYVGPLAPFAAADIARHPELKDYPVMELALEKTLSKTARYASLYRVASGFLGFGETRVKTATVSQPAANLTVLRATAVLPRGRYAVACGPQSYEIAVE